LKRPLKWDPVKEKFVNDKEANNHITPIYNNSWKIPRVL